MKSVFVDVLSNNSREMGFFGGAINHNSYKIRSHLVGQPVFNKTLGGSGVSALEGSGVVGRLNLGPPALVGNTGPFDGPFVVVKGGGGVEAAGTVEVSGLDSGRNL